MPFYIRKSVKAGPFRFNFSKGGVGVSVGVKGLRLGTGPRGHYIHAGRGGLYYRASLGSKDNRRSGEARVIPAQLAFDETTVNMVEVESGDVMEMRDENFAELLDEINAKSRQWRLSVFFGWAMVLIGLFQLFQSPQSGLWILVAAFPAWAIGAWIDSFRRSTVLFYDIDGPVEQAYKDTVAAFDELSACAGKWHVEAGGVINDLTTWKRNAGASYLVKRKATKLDYALPGVIKSNITPPSLHVGKQVIYFFPDVALVSDNARFGAVSYPDLHIRWQSSRFIEEGPVPRDAKIIDHTWQHPNKSGGPDRRFRINRQLPICLYETMHLQSDSGLNEIVEFSQIGKLSDFVQGCSSLARAKEEISQAPIVVPTNVSISEEPAPSPMTPNSFKPATQKSWSGVLSGALIVGGISIVPIAMALFQNSGHHPRSADAQRSVSTGSNNSAATKNGSPVDGTDANLKQTQVPKIPSVVAKSEQEPAPDASAFEALAAAVVAKDILPAKATAQPTRTLPYVGDPQPKFAYMKQSIQLRDGPGQKYIPVGDVGQNALLRFLETEDGWVHVFGGASVSGWVPKELLSESPVSNKPSTPKVPNNFSSTSRSDR
ncbi:DUF4236 domain-containing protein [Agrobacterium vitis]